tara:strand:- start:228 stop:482 length:255 start_codon:yes stop_codon:yes gene_type:complete
MQYFIVMQGESLENCMNETNLLGEDNGFGVFWAGSGLEALMNIVNSHPEYIEGKALDIVTDKGEFLNVEQFLKSIEHLKVRIQQ